MKTIDTLVGDIYEVIKGNGGWNATISQTLGKDISNLAAERFTNRQEPRGYLSMSSLGTPCKRKIWYKVNKASEQMELPSAALLKFFFGDMVESLVLNLAIAAGHKVEGMQSRMEINGIKGHRDAVIDGMTVDVKSASPLSFAKFKEGRLRQDDPFGYISQLSSYVYAGQDDDTVVDKTRGAFLVVDKVNGHIYLDVHDFTEELKNKEQEIEDIKALVKGDLPEERFDPVPLTKDSPNTKLCLSCSYCDFRELCWPEARTFIYSKGPVHLVDVVNEPKVPELGKEDLRF